MSFIHKWLLNIIAKKIGKEVGDKMEDNSKQWYKSKNVWNSIVVGVIGVYEVMDPAQGWPAIPAWILTLLAASGIYTRITATKTIGAPATPTQ